MTRESWTTRTGFILAAVGSAVGLGNVWRFPWMTAENGGSAFLVLYLGLVLFVGVPGLVAEFVIGRRSRRNPVGALSTLSESDRWGIVGLLPVVTTVFLLSFYSVVGGWILRYFVASATGAYFDAPGAYFDAVAFGPSAVAYHVVFLLLTAAIVVAGVRRGIEAATKVMMPAIVVLLVGLAAWGTTLSGSGDGLTYFLSFDAAYLRNNFFDVLGAATGQALFTLSVGAGTMITYASYIGEDRSLPADSAVIAVFNTSVGVVAGLVVFPLLFAQGLPVGESGPGALFVSLASAFSTLPAGRLVAVVFFGVMTLAALSSSISMLELPVAYLVDEHGFGRRRATAAMSSAFLVFGTVNALRPAIFDFVASTLVDLLLSLGLLCFLLFAGWVLGTEAVEEFRNGAGPLGRSLGSPWLYVVGVALPVFLIFTVVTGILGAVNVSLGSTVVVALTAVLAAAAFVALRRSRSVL
ncbi:sodium-dependent transporter [Halostella sp. JP-L12]|uniref:sodium-dependent transporter n=1 Tax=Halostella TaxID=1843185 RepID=UPI000EF7B508|nr:MULTISPECIES: sodium-dependent transporter [Halostella]NHN48482.1 sodium-dependent transporter [Halostella sp. JP-L12]